MAFYPQHEDYQRMSLRFARTMGGSDPYRAAREMMSFPRRFRSMRDSLPQTDGDRAFHLVSRATDIIDYRLPFVDEASVEPLIAEARKLLDEAIELDESCSDARRMREIAERPSFSALCAYLQDNRDTVRGICEAARSRETQGLGAREARLAADLSMRPYVRWLAMQASKLLICGRYRRAAEVGEELLAMDARDSADVRYTLAIAYAKLEDEAALDSLEARTAPLSLVRKNGRDPWMLLARAAMAHKNRNFEAGIAHVDSMLENWPRAALTLTRQDELPDGVFSRIVVGNGTEDELILATSEAIVLLQEGREVERRGPFGAWLAARAEEAGRAELARQGASAPVEPAASQAGARGDDGNDTGDSSTDEAAGRGNDEA